MGVTSNVSKVKYTCNGSTGPYPITFDVARDSDGDAEQLTVTIRDSSNVETELTSSYYTVSGLNVYTVSNYAASNEIVISRDMDFLQDRNWDNGESIDLDDLTDAFDEAYMCIQQLYEIYTRNVYGKISDPSGVSLELPAASVRAGQNFIFDNSGNVAAGTGLTATVSPYLSSWLNNETAASALIELGISATAEEINTVLDGDTLVTSSNWHTVLARTAPPFVPIPIHMSLLAAIQSPKYTGTNTSVGTSELNDSGATFLTSAVAGDIVHNITDDRWASISVTDSNTKLLLNWDAVTDVTVSYAIYTDPVDLADWPDNLVLCDGSTISDADSPMNGLAVPDMNGAAANDGRTIRGGETAGIEQADAMQGHKHNTATQTISRQSPGSNTGVIDDYPGVLAYVTSSPITDGTNGTPRTDDETRMKNLSVVYIMRIK